MKQLFKHTYQYFLVLGILLTTNASLKAQSTAVDTTSDKLAKTLSINKEKAKQIQSALNYRHEEITNVMKDPNIKPADKQKQLKRLFADRKHKIDSTMTPALKQKLNELRADDIKKENDRRAAFEKKHEQDMEKTPHKRTLKTPQIDTTQKKAKTK